MWAHHVLTLWGWVKRETVMLTNEHTKRIIRVGQITGAAAHVIVDRSEIAVHLESGTVCFELQSAHGDFKMIDPSCSASNMAIETSTSLSHVLAALEAWFADNPLRDRVEVLLPDPLSAQLCELGIAVFQNEKCLVTAEMFWQLSLPWCSKGMINSYPLCYAESGESNIPVRPRQPTGDVYARYIPWLGKTLSFKVADIDRDLVQFNRWMNDPRVSFFWEEEGDLDYHRAFLETQLADSRVIPLIGFFDAQPFGYFEVYWAKEDRLAPFCQATDFDRGFHLLVGEETFRGRQWLEAWYPSLLHYMFLDDVRTQRVMAEPRADNERLLRCSEMLGFEKLKEFDFPHKRAALISLSRTTFFGSAQQLSGSRPSD